jgi:hypothetical protein
MFTDSPANENVITYLKKRMATTMTLVIEQNQIEVLAKMIDSEKFFTKMNVDKYILRASEAGKSQIQLMLTDYKK